jgi:hypothetical protein
MRIAVWPILLLLALAAPTRAQDVREAGVTAAANPAVEGTPPSATARLLQVGVKVFERERVISQADGQAQLLFRDGSSFTVGPNSDMVIDDFVFDPAAGTGRIAMSLGKGVFRFVGGKLSKDGSVALTTPSAVLGVRGGIALIEVGDGGATTATLVYGAELSVRSRTGETARLVRPGFAITVPDARSPPSPPVRVTPDQLARAVAPLRGQPGRAGGLAQAPPPPMVSAMLRAPVALAPMPSGPMPSGPTPSGSTAAPPPPPGSTTAAPSAGAPGTRMSPFVGAPPPLKAGVQMPRPNTGPRPPPPPPPRPPQKQPPPPPPPPH